MDWIAVGEGLHLQLKADDLLRSMDSAGIGKAAIAAVDRCLAVDNREGNELVADTVRAHPDRFLAWASANPWFGEGAKTELHRAKTIVETYSH